tara:strand:- start:59 stop:385 length:327 start_codon:yes stop_codon:yes gene_type:complete
MDHQDWNVVILNPKKHLKTNTEQYQNSRAAKIENSESLSHKRVGLSLGKQISNARIAKGFVTQRELANALCCSPSVVADYESGKAIPDNKVMQKLRYILTIKLVVPKN